jgi:hypothetical protein
MSGFIHVPLLSHHFGEDTFLAGVAIVLRTCVDAYLETERARLAPGPGETDAEARSGQS